MISILKEKQNYLLWVVSGANRAKGSCVWCFIPLRCSCNWSSEQTEDQGRSQRGERVSWCLHHSAVFCLGWAYLLKGCRIHSWCPPSPSVLPPPTAPHLKKLPVPSTLCLSAHKQRLYSLHMQRSRPINKDAVCFHLLFPHFNWLLSQLVNRHRRIKLTFRLPQEKESHYSSQDLSDNFDSVLEWLDP